MESTNSVRENPESEAWGLQLQQSNSLLYEPPPDVPPASGTTVQVIGFVQLFVVQVFPGGGGKMAGEFEAADREIISVTTARRLRCFSGPS